jgi:hypothetical protein
MRSPKAAEVLPKSFGKKGNRLSTAGDIAIPINMAVEIRPDAILFRRGRRAIRDLNRFG